MFVGAYAGRKNLRNIGVGDDGKSVVDGPGGRGVFVGRHLAERKDKGEDAVFIVAKVCGKVARLHAAERQRRAVGEAQRINQRRHVPAERHQPRFPAQLHALFGKLFGKLLAVCAPGHENVKIFFLELAGDWHGDLIGGGRAGDGRKSRRCAVHELNAALPHDHVIGGAQPDAVNRVGPDEIFAGLDDFAREKRRHPGVKRVAQIWQPDILGRPLRQQFLGAYAARGGNRPSVLHFFAGKGINHREDNRPYRETRLARPSPFCLLRLVKHRLGARHPSRSPRRSRWRK